MKVAWNGFQAGIAAIGGGLGWFLGGFDGFVYALVVFVVLDYITGFALAVTEKKLSSEIGFRGILKKVMIFVMVAIGHIIDKQLIGNGDVIRMAVIFFYLTNEGLSLIENAVRVGLPVPEKLKDILAQLHKGGGKSDDK